MTFPSPTSPLDLPALTDQLSQLADEFAATAARLDGAGDHAADAYGLAAARIRALLVPHQQKGAST